MMSKIINSITTCIATLLLSACVGHNVHDKNIPPQTKHLMPGTASHLQHGKELFNQHQYTEAMRELLPLACDCVAEAEYAVGFMYYNGYGVAQDTEVGTFWIRRAARDGYKPANEALKTIADDTYHNTKNRQWPRNI